MNDYISRQNAIDSIKTNHYDPCEFYNESEQWAVGFNAGIAHAIHDLTYMPSAQPEPKKGKWMEHYSHEDGERDGVYCSNCEEWFYFGGQFMNYCPNCGADMRMENDD